jgi:hypothetical protein
MNWGTFVACVLEVLNLVITVLTTVKEWLLSIIENINTTQSAINLVTKESFTTRP